MEFKPHDYQRFTINKILENNKYILILDMGLGKTVSTLTAINELIYERFEINKVLVIAPLMVANLTWPEEVDKWDHLRHLKISKVIGTVKERISALRTHADIYLINRENVKWLISVYAEKKQLKGWPFDWIVIDESSSFKNHASQRFKEIKKATSLDEVKRVTLLTGTPTPNGLIDLWSQIYLLDNGERLGKNITRYRKAFFIKSVERNYKSNTSYETYTLKSGMEKLIYNKINDIAVSMKAVDHLKLPERVDNFIKIKMDDNSKYLYSEFEKSYVLEFEEETLKASSAAALSNKLLQLTGGAVYDDNRNVVEIHSLKLDALEQILEDNTKPVLVAYNYEHELNRILERFKKHKPRQLNKDKKNSDVKALWDRGEIRLMVVHPASVGHGLNLQSGGSIIVWYGIPWSLELYQQLNSRLYRQGQKEVTVINHLVLKGTIDEVVVKALQGKCELQDEFIKAVKAKIKFYKTEKN